MSMQLTLCDAVETGNVSVVTQMISTGGDPNMKERSELPLTLAARRGDLKMVEALISMDADKEGRNSQLDTALILASREGYAEIVQYLVEEGVNIHAKNSKGQTALLAAIEGGSHDIVTFLLSHQPDLGTMEDTALINCVKYKRTNLLDLWLLKYPSLINRQDSEGNTAMHVAVEQNNVDCCAILLRKGIDVTIKNKRSYTAVDIAQRTNKTAIYDMVAAQLRQKNAVAPLLFACEMDDIEGGQKLISPGNVNKKANNGDTPLIIACRAESVQLCKYLAEQGANVDLQNDDGCTPLHEAVKAGNIVLLKEILCHLPKLLPDKNGNTALDIAKSAPLKIQSMIENYAAETPKAIVNRVDVSGTYHGSQGYAESTSSRVDVSGIYHGSQSYAESTSSRASTPQRERFANLTKAVMLHSGNASQLTLKCKHPILSSNQEMLTEVLKPDEALLTGLYESGIWDLSDLSSARKDESLGKVKRVLQSVDQRGDQGVRDFIAILQKTDQAPVNKELGQRLKSSEQRVPTPATTKRKQHCKKNCSEKQHENSKKTKIITSLLN